MRDVTRLLELRLVAHSLGAGLVSAEPVGWGDSGVTYRITLDDGRSIAARRVADDGGGARTDAMRRRMVWLAEAGLPVPSPRTVDTDDGSWLLTPWVDGAPGADWLDDPHRARLLAQRMGELAMRIQQLATATLTPFAHGDFAPINVIVDADGAIVALLDFEHAGPGPGLLDVAWWGWVVRHHHPKAWEAAWPVFLAGAGLECGPVEVGLHALALQALEDRAAAAPVADARRRWLDHLAKARRWRVPG